MESLLNTQAVTCTLIHQNMCDMISNSKVEIYKIMVAKKDKNIEDELVDFFCNCDFW